MARPMNPLPVSAAPLVLFARELRALRKKAGDPPLQDMTQLCGVSPATLSKAQSGVHRPSWSAVVGYVTACGGDPKQWQARWQRLRLSAASADAAETAGAALSRWAKTGELTPPPKVAAHGDLCELLQALLRFQGLSLRELSRRAPGYSHSSYGAMLRGKRPVKPRMLKEFLAGCGVVSRASVEAWFKALLALDPGSAFEVAQLLQKRRRATPKTSPVQLAGVMDALQRLETARDRFTDPEETRSPGNIRTVRLQVREAYRALTRELYRVAIVAHGGRLPQELQTHAKTLEQTLNRGGRLPHHLLDRLLSVAIPRQNRQVRFVAFRALQDADRIITSEGQPHPTEAAEQMALLPADALDKDLVMGRPGRAA